MRILVTGANGFIGQALVRRLADDPDKEIIVLVREKPEQQLAPALAEMRPQLDLVFADLRNFSLTSRAVRHARPDVVIHLAAVGVTDPFLNINTAIRHNLHATLNLLRVCFERDMGIQRLVISRTPGERSAMNVYAASKAATWKFCQMFCRTQHWPIIGAMIFQAYGPGQPRHTLIPAAIAAARGGTDFPMTSGMQERDWIWIDDVAAGLAAIVPAEISTGETIDLGTGQLTTVAAVVQQIYHLVNRGGRPRPGFLPDRSGEVSRQVADTSKAYTLLGWQASVSLVEGLGRLANSYDSSQ